MTKLDFHRFQVRHFSNTFEHCCAAVELGQRQRADISLFIATYNSPTGEISAFERIHALQPPFCFLGHPYIGRHYRVSLILVWRNVIEVYRIDSLLCISNVECRVHSFIIANVSKHKTLDVSATWAFFRIILKHMYSVDKKIKSKRKERKKIFRE